VCGTDGCDGSCGDCEGEEVCSSAGLCITVDPSSLSFFVTSQGNLSGNFGGIDGADDFCQGLAEAASAGDRVWRAYVSTADEDARDRIGTGPWVDAAGETVATSIAALHADGLFHDNALDENGDPVPNGKSDPGFNEHDILTGSNQDDTFSGSDCDGWTSNGDGQATTGHCDASFTASGGSSPVDSGDNWNASHETNGCDADRLNGTGSTARLYCFAE